ncbi:MAG: hypothetical protein IAE79_02635 [Anaerolinea sp.]|nr:hypothetical protein [Anaerolinea sp.]
MTTDFHTPISFEADADSSVVNAPLADLDAAIGLQGGGASAKSAYLLANYVAAMNRLSGAPTPHGTYPDVIGSASVIWPDGSAGTYTAVTVNGTWLEATNWTLTHTSSGKTLTFSGLVRNSSGFITTPGTLAVS